MQRVGEAFNDGAQVCDKIVPVIPIRMTESWMLADPAALIAVVGTNTSPTDLSLPGNPSQVERIADPEKEAARSLKHRSRWSLSPPPSRSKYW